MITPTSIYRYLLPCALVIIAQSPECHGLIHYDGDEAGNITDPGTGVPYYAVARLGDEGAALTSIRGTAVYFTGKYLLTANHNQIGEDLTFDNITYWAIDDAFTPVQIGTTDMKIIKLVKDPGLQDVSLMSGSSITQTGTIVAWGKGRDLGVPDSGGALENIWTWPGGNDNSTVAKRWGTNRIDSTSTETYSFGGVSYSYTSLVTDLDKNAGMDEVAACLYDSGSGIFVEDGATWKLAGLTTLTTHHTSTSPKTATFRNFSGGGTHFVEISTYKTDIEDEIPDLSTYSGWKVDHSLYAGDADDNADTDDDGIGQLHEFAFGGDPNENDISILPTFELTEDGGSTYLELKVTRPIGIQDIDYTPQTTTDIASWPGNSAGIVDDDPTPVDNLDGTETLTYRRSATVSSVDEAFIRIDVSEAP